MAFICLYTKELIIQHAGRQFFTPEVLTVTLIVEEHMNQKLYRSAEQVLTAAQQHFFTRKKRDDLCCALPVYSDS